MFPCILFFTLQTCLGEIICSLYFTFYSQSLNTEVVNEGHVNKLEKEISKTVIDNVDEEDLHEKGDEDCGVPYEELCPTYTHEALCKLFQLGFLKYSISQNGDGLHGLPGIPEKDLSELHGNVFIEECEKCDTHYERPFMFLMIMQACILKN